MANPSITKKALAEAMKKLMDDQPLTKISVGDIVTECGLNRNSFYYHFKDKYDLVNWIFYVEIVDLINKEELPQQSLWALLEKTCSCFYANKKFYTNALSVSGQNSFSEYYIHILKGLIKARLDENDYSSDHPELYSSDQDFYISFFTDAFVSAIFRWIQEGAIIPPEKLTNMMYAAARGAAMIILDHEHTPATEMLLTDLELNEA